MIFVYMAMIDSLDDRHRFETIYTNNRDLLYHYAYRILQDEASAEDAVHDAFVSYAKSFDRYKEMNAVQTRNFLMITVRNAAFKLYNKRKRETVTDEFYGEDTALPDVSIHTEQQDVRRIVFEMVKALDPKYGDVVMLKYYYNMSIQQIAEHLDLTAENVKVRLHRARALLKSKLEGAGIVEG